MGAFHRLVLLCAAFFTSVAFAQTYPNKAVKIIVPYPPGGGTDLLARMVGQRLSEKWGQPVVIDNRAGATGVIATELAARSAADGYTLFLGTTGELAVNPAVKARLSFNAEHDFAPAILISVSPLVFVIHPSVPASNLREFAAAARKEPGKLAYASPGSGSPHQILGEMVKVAMGIDIIHIPYKGGGPQMNDVVAGHVASAIVPLAIAAPYLKEGKLRALGVSSGKRVAAFPEIPTLDEAGATGVELLQWRGLLAPAGTPKGVVARIYDDTREVIRLPEVTNRLRELAEEPVNRGGEDFAKLISSDIAKFRRIVKEANIQVD